MSFSCAKQCPIQGYFVFFFFVWNDGKRIMQETAQSNILHIFPTKYPLGEVCSYNGISTGVEGVKLEG